MILIIITGIIGAGCYWFFTDSNFAIKEDFNSAFNARVTGDCGSFLEYINGYENKVQWLERCEFEKNLEGPPIREFSILKVSHDFFEKNAYVQVKLSREKGYDYVVSYDLKKDDDLWKINQGVKK